MGLTGADLVWMREQLAELLPDTAIILRAEDVSDGAGGRTTVWTAAGTVAARLDPATQSISQQMELLALRPALLTSYLLTVPYDADLRAHDRVQVGSTVYTVIGLWREQHADWRVCRRAIVALEA